MLDALSTGATNAEIARTLGITTDGVKWHVSGLLAETGLEDRNALAVWWQSERERNSTEEQGAAILVLAILRRAWPASLILAVLAVAGVLVLVRAGNDHSPAQVIPLSMALDEPPVTATVPLSDPSVTAPPDCEASLPNDFGPASAEELRSQGLVEVGRVVEARSCPMRVSNRPDQAFFWLADGGKIEFEAASLHRVTSFGMYGGSSWPAGDLGFYYGGEQFRASMFLADVGRNGSDDQSSRVTANIAANGDTDLSRADDGGAFVGVTLEGEVSGPHRVALDSQGDLFFDPAPLSGDLATNWRTGEPLDVTRMKLIGRLTLNVLPDKVPVDSAPRNGCDVPRRVCVVLLPALNSVIEQAPTPGGAPSFAGSTIPAPVDGVLSCVPVEWPGGQLTGYELDSGTYHLRFIPYGGYGTSWNRGCTSHLVKAGDPLNVWVYTEIDAFSSDGSPLAVVATRDGHLYVGDVTLQMDCPCQHGV